MGFKAVYVRKSKFRGKFEFGNCISYFGIVYIAIHYNVVHIHSIEPLGIISNCY